MDEKDFKNYVRIRTTENTDCYVRKSMVSVVENIPETARTEGYLKLYISGYSFGVKEDFESFVKKLDE